MSRPKLGTTQIGAHDGSAPYGRPIIKQPVWTWEIPWYFFTGGLAGASSLLAFGAERTGNDVLARRAWAAALGGVTASPVLLIMDLGRPARFLNMLRLFKVTSPMSVGSWILTASGLAVTLACTRSWTGLLDAPGRAGGAAAAALGGPLATYTAALVADTSVPVWHEARHVLPFVFGGSAAASAGAVAVATTPAKHAGPARLATVAGAVVEVAGTQAMESMLDGRGVGRPYHEGAAGTLAKVAKGLTVAGAALVGLGGRRSRRAALAGAALVTAGSVCERWSVFKAGFQSAARPQDTVRPQRERIAQGAHPSARQAGAAAVGG